MRVIGPVSGASFDAIEMATADLELRGPKPVIRPPERPARLPVQTATFRVHENE